LEFNPSIQIYEKEYARHLKDYREISSKKELIRRVLASDIVFHGDYHTMRQSQRSVLRILREIQRKRRIILCLEMFHGSDQKFVDRYMAGELSEGSFIRKIDYAKKWPFRWLNWSPIIHFCRNHHIPIVGINSLLGEGIDGLRNRDTYSARIIVKTLIRNPDKLIYVVDGDFHISPNHLPKEVETLLKLMDIQAKRLIIFQNPENLYWKLCRQGKEEADVLRINDNSYCIMNTLPANKVQSYLNWLEYAEDAYYPIDSEWKDEAFESEGITIEEMVNTICSVLNLKLPKDAMQKMRIHYADDFHFMDRIYNIPELKGKRHAIKAKIKKGEGFLLEYDSSGEDIYLIYLPNSNINMAAEEAAHFINAALRGRLTRDLTPFDSFYRNAVTECLGFFGSKFINEKRKSHSENSLRRLLGQIKRGECATSDQMVPRVSRLLLQHFYLQRKSRDAADFKHKFSLQYKSRSVLPIIFSTQLGYILGNRLYYAVKRGQFPITKIREYFRHPFDRPEEAFDCYLNISNRIKKVKTITQF